MVKSAAKEKVLKSVEREFVDLSHWVFRTGRIGQLQTLTTVPVLAGDSMMLNFSGVFRLSPLRRNLYLDPRVDLFAFYIPMRHIYSNWMDFILGGYDESVTLGTDTLLSGVSLECVGLKTGTATTLPRWLTRGYIQIWNNYFRDPSDVAGIKADNVFTTLTYPSATDQPVMMYGYPACHLPALSTRTIVSNLTTGDYSLPLSGGEVDILQFAALKGRLRTEQTRDFYGIRYEDIIKSTWGADINTDARPRPTVCAHVATFMSGIDVDGTAGDNLGTYSGKSVSICNLRMPWKFFPEHGTFWVMCLVRFPFVHTEETHYLVTKAEPTYAQIAGDPSVILTQAPVVLNYNDILVGSSSVTVGSIPFGEWWRTHPSGVHVDYRDTAGHPFLPDMFTDRNSGLYIGTNQYFNIFQSTQLGHWNEQGHVGLYAKRFVPDRTRSIFAGSDV